MSRSQRHPARVARMPNDRVRAFGGVVGPAGFVAAWSVLGLMKDGYSPLHDPISRLAAVDASTRVPMTLGFLVFGGGVAAYAGALSRALPGGAGRMAAATAAATVGVALLPLGSSVGGRPHAVAATIGYATLAATPLLGGRSLARLGRRRAAAWSVVAGLASAASFTASIVTEGHTGLFQRAGIVAGDAWIVATAYWLARRPAG